MIDLSYKLFVRALSNKTRLEILNLLRKGPKTVSDIVSELNFEQSRVSHNLKCLVDCGFVTVEQNGKNRIYAIDQKTVLPMLKLMDQHIDKYFNHLLKCGIIKHGG